MHATTVHRRSAPRPHGIGGDAQRGQSHGGAQHEPPGRRMAPLPHHPRLHGSMRRAASGSEWQRLPRRIPCRIAQAVARLQQSLRVRTPARLSAPRTPPGPRRACGQEPLLARAAPSGTHGAARGAAPSTRGALARAPCQVQCLAPDDPARGEIILDLLCHLLGFGNSVSKASGNSARTPLMGQVSMFAPTIVMLYSVPSAGLRARSGRPVGGWKLVY
jgi:hypothetical protein